MDHQYQSKTSQPSQITLLV